MDGFQVQCVTEQKRQVLSGTQIGQPVPVEGGFAANDEIFGLERLQRDEEFFRRPGVEVPVDLFLSVVVDDVCASEK